MTTLRNEKKLPAMNRKNHEDHPRNIQARNTNSPRIQENYFTQVSEEIEDRVIKKLSQDFSETEVRILGALFGWMNFFWTHKLGLTPDPFPSHLGT